MHDTLRPGMACVCQPCPGGAVGSIIPGFFSARRSGGLPAPRPRLFYRAEFVTFLTMDKAA